MIKNKSLVFLIPIFIIFVATFTFSACTAENQGVADIQGQTGEVTEEVDEDTSDFSPEPQDTDQLQQEDDDEGQNDEDKDEGYKNDFTLLDLEGNEVSLSDYEGQIVVINFWATWCNPCKMEIPDFIEVYEQYKDEGVEFLGVSNDNVESLKRFVDEYGIEYPTLIDGSIDSISDYWRISAIPTTYIVDGSGNAVFRQIGLMTKNQLINAIEEHI